MTVVIPAVPIRHIVEIALYSNGSAAGFERYLKSGSGVAIAKQHLR